MGLWKLIQRKIITGTAFLATSRRLPQTCILLAGKPGYAIGWPHRAVQFLPEIIER
jgi:hypothetical protein